jgi:hypothetical protein
MVRAKARIQWLEDVVRTHLPSFDLNGGPQVDFEPLASDDNRSTTSAPPIMHATSTLSTTLKGNSPNKRPHTTLDDKYPAETLTSDAQSVALDLGMLTLNSDTRERYYMGSSSGLYFTHLLQNQPSSGEFPQPPRYRQHVAKHAKEDFATIHQALRFVRTVRLQCVYC